MTGKARQRSKITSQEKKKVHETDDSGDQQKHKSTSSSDTDALAADNKVVKIDYKRITIRCIVILLIIAAVNFSHKESLECFASEKDEIEKKEEVVQCSQDYANELKQFHGCVPRRCGRMVSDTVVTLSDVQALLIIAQKGFSLGGSAGGASILDLHSGALSKDNTFINIYQLDKSNKVITREDLKVYSHIKNKIKATIVKHFGLKADRLYLTHPTFFSCITSAPAQTIHDEYWHPHVDKETYSSFHYTSLLYLTDYGHHFKGGRFVFVDSPLNKTVEPRSGRLSVFTSGSENLHYVEKVTSGTRYAITVSFTCDPKYAISDPKISGKT